MNLSKYKNSLILFIFYIFFWIIIISILKELFKPSVTIALTRFLPLNDILLELAFIFIIIFPLSPLFGLFIGGYIIAPIILYLHKKIYGSKVHYGIQVEQRLEKIKIFSKSFFPVLMAINLSSILLTPTIIQFILTSDVIIEFDNVSKIPMLTRFFADVTSLMFTFGLATMFFSSVWFLRDSGVIYSNKAKIEDSNESIVLRSIGDWFQTILRSYAGIGAIFTYILTVSDFITKYIDNYGLPGNVFNIPSLILWLGMPFYIILSLIPTIVINDIIKRNRINYIRKLSQKIGIEGTAFISFEFKKGSET